MSDSEMVSADEAREMLEALDAARANVCDCRHDCCVRCTERGTTARSEREACASIADIEGRLWRVAAFDADRGEDCEPGWKASEEIARQIRARSEAAS